MVLFFEYKAKQRRESEPCCYAWCNTDTILAIGNRANEVNMFLGEGNLMERGTITGKCNPSALAWHPAHVSSAPVGRAEGSLTPVTVSRNNRRNSRTYHVSATDGMRRETAWLQVMPGRSGCLGAQNHTMNVMTQYRKSAR